MKNRQQLVNRALKELDVNPLTTESYASVDELVDGVFEQLHRKNIVYIVPPSTATATIPESAFLPIAHCLAYQAAVEMGKNDRVADLFVKCGKAEDDLRLMDRNDHPDRHWFTMRSDYPVSCCLVGTTS
jgi:hypothetical protein